MSDLVHPGDDQTAGIAPDSMWTRLGRLWAASAPPPLPKTQKPLSWDELKDFERVQEYEKKAAAAMIAARSAHPSLARIHMEHARDCQNFADWWRAKNGWYVRGLFSDGPKGQDEASPSNGMTP